MEISLSNIDESHTLYAVHLLLPTEVEIAIGKLGTFKFPKGHYIYVGSAKRNIKARVDRHIKVAKPLRWHFDYLREHGVVTEVETFSNVNVSECGLRHQIQMEREGKTLVSGFGSSDCKCISHLLFIGE